MIKKYKENIFLVFSLLMFIASFLYYTTSVKKPEQVQMTAFLTDYSEGIEYTMLKQGMEQAAIDYNAELTFRTIRNEDTTTELLRMIDKEVESQTQAIILQPKNKLILGEKLKELNKLISVSLVNSTIDMEESLPVVATDTYSLGQKLAEQMLLTSLNNKPILMLKENFDYTETFHYYQGIASILDSASVSYEVREVKGKNQENQIKELLKKQEYAGVIAFTPSMLELVGKVKTDSNKSELRIFGFQKTNAALALIDNGVVEAIGLSNQFTVGYQAVQQIFMEEINQSDEVEIQQMIVDKTNLFSEENQKLLFPVVQ